MDVSEMTGWPGHDGGAWIPAPSRTVATRPAGYFAENVAVADDGTVFVSLHSHNRRQPQSWPVTPNRRFDGSVRPIRSGQTGRGVEIRSQIQIVAKDAPLIPGFSRETFQLYPHRIISWNVGEFALAASGHPAHLQGYNSRAVAG